ncbi:TetR/AcrR family transcriptional regulator [Actinobacteria bacterium YIM 96077]|uniref:TetR/AcrR family transcriptional regulator n=1 Tax=Phytoactinopolyspora halophila TaxID=1981511 RepID=A0A329QCH0_9ACTN|nr:TetR family transcriptional regulator [Phytoactinopolyspora halophila]AYY14117.1 TetR/AcrR family transcriptional regulator [Actinobacteria bacterium YIM 96077]RAW09947.1 TetR/AcrR family transcriptional regulator [Phytoactinopolyspora halophila]
MRRASEETKATILDAARDRFAADGYERATIRAIAADACIDPSMVMRYFGSKEKLFAAAAHFDLELPSLVQVPRSEVGERLVRHFLDRWEGDEALMILLRSGVTNAVAAERMQAIFAEQLAPVVAEVAADPSAPASTRAGLVASQILGLALCRYVLRFPPVVEMSREEVVRWVAPTVQRYLADPAVPPPTPR